VKILRTTAGRPLNQKELERKIADLSSIQSSCNSSRGHIIYMFSQTINPFENPEFSIGFNELIGNDGIFKKHAVDLREENKQWKALCDFCQTEVNKANQELIQILNPGASPKKVFF
jgi:hypothetical protein